MEHPFFDDFNWEALEQQTMPAPIKLNEGETFYGKFEKGSDVYDDARAPVVSENDAGRFAGF